MRIRTAAQDLRPAHPRDRQVRRSGAPAVRPAPERMAAAARRFRTSSVWRRMRSNLSGSIAPSARPSIFPPIARNLAFEPGGDLLRVMRLQGRAQFGRHGVQRREQRFAVAVFAQHGDPLRQIADRALESDDRVARRQVRETSRHRGDLDAHRLDLRGADARAGLFATHVVEPADEDAKVLDQGRGSRGRAAASRRGADRRADRSGIERPRARPDRHRRASRSPEVRPARDAGRRMRRALRELRSPDGAWRSARPRPSNPGGASRLTDSSARPVSRAESRSVVASRRAASSRARRSSFRIVFERSIIRAIDSKARAARSSLCATRLSKRAIVEPSKSSPSRSLGIIAAGIRTQSSCGRGRDRSLLGRVAKFHRGVFRRRLANRFRRRALAPARWFPALGRPPRRAIPPGACRRGARPPRRRAAFEVQRRQYSTLGLCSLLRPSLALAIRHCAATTLRTNDSAAMVKKRLRTPHFEASPSRRLHKVVSSRATTFSCILLPVGHSSGDSRRGARISKARTQRRRRKESS